MKYMKSFFSFKGRSGRMEYLLSCLLLLSMALFVGAISDSLILTGVILLLYVTFIFQTIKRLHDIDLHGWWSLLVLVPLVNILAGAWVLLKKGTVGKNRFDLIK